EDKIIQITKNRYKVWYQINRAASVSDDSTNKKFDVTRCSRVTRSKIKRKGLGLEMTRTLFKFVNQCHRVEPTLISREFALIHTFAKSNRIESTEKSAQS